jgi:hypothetical protein
MAKNESSVGSAYVSDVGSNDGDPVENQMVNSINSNVSGQSGNSSQERDGSVKRLAPGYPQGYSNAFQGMIKK